MSQVANKEALVLGTGEVSIALDVNTIQAAEAAGMRDLGALAKVSLEVEKEEQDQYIPNRGLRVLARSALTQIDMMYKITCQELRRDNLLMALAATSAANFTQAALSAEDGEVLPFSTTPAAPSRWYQLKDSSGNELHNLTLVTIPTKTEGTDFFVDHKTGRIRFAAAESSDLTPNITCPAITQGDVGNLKGMNPTEGGQTIGVARIHIFDDNHANKLIFDSGYIQTNIQISSFGEFDGENFLDFELDMKVLAQLSPAMVAEE